MGRSEDDYKNKSLKEKLLTPEIEKDLARKIKTGEKEAFDRFYRANLRLVAKEAGRFHKKMPWVPESDLIQDGNLGLWDAVKGYDPEKGFRFSTYAAPIIRQRMISGVRERTGIIYIPQEVQKARAKLIRGLDQFLVEFGYCPGHFELCQHLGIDLNMAKTLEKLPTSVSIEAMRQSRRNSILLDRITDNCAPNPLDAVIESMEMNELYGLLSHLSARKRDILFRRFSYVNGQPELLGSIGATWDVTKERIRQLQNEALDELREHAGALPDTSLLNILFE